MGSLQFNILPPPPALQADIACIRLSTYTGADALAIHVSLNGTPGLVLQQQTNIENIVTRSGRQTGTTPPFFIYGQNTEPSVMHFTPGTFTMTQVIFKPHGLRTLLGINAPELTNNALQLSELAHADLTEQLLAAKSGVQQVSVITQFLIAQQQRIKARDIMIEASLHLMEEQIDTITVKYLLDHFSISERQFEKRFQQSVGLTPQFYIRIQRFKAAVRLLKTGQFHRLTDIAHALNYYDQSHFIRDVKAFAGLTPKSLRQHPHDYAHDEAGYSYM